MTPVSSSNIVPIMKASIVATLIGVGACLLGGCQGGGKQNIPLSGGQTYLLQSSGKLKVYPGAGAEGAPGSQPLQKLQVKRKNEGAGAATPGCA